MPAIVPAIAVIASHQLAQIQLFRVAADGPVEMLPFFNIVEVWNSGVSFGMFNKLPHGQWILSALALAITLALTRWLLVATDLTTRLALGLIIGGALGNTIDRIRYGAVADYFDFHTYGHHWPAFNVTDSAVFVGVLLLLLPIEKTTAR